MKGWTIALAILTLLAVGKLGAWAGAQETVEATVQAHSTPKLRIPPGWPKPQYDFGHNPVTAAGFRLGRQLFYDPLLSRDGSVSCGSCHQQFAAFANLDHRVSHGIGSTPGLRNAPALFNLAWAPSFMWDGAVRHLELQPIAPLNNHLEMGETLEHVLLKLRRDPNYSERFRLAFGTSEISSQRMLRALTQFIGTMVSANTRYDAYLNGEPSLNPEELKGLNVFRGKCSSCHSEPLLTDFSFRNNGLDRKPRDAGREGITGKAADRGLFRVPSLRNVALTAPYMHDGRFETLDQVLDHYGSGIQPSSTLDPRLAHGFRLSRDEHAQLRQFLGTLSDEQFIKDLRFSERQD